jgi:hypothetical protein
LIAVEVTDDDVYDEDHRATSSRVARLEPKLDRIDGGMHSMGGKLDEQVKVVLPSVNAAARAREEGRCVGRGAAQRGRKAVRVGGGGGKDFRRKDNGKRTARDEDERYYTVSRMAHLETALDSV